MVKFNRVLIEVQVFVMLVRLDYMYYFGHSKGATPKAVVISVDAVGLKTSVIVHWPE